MIYTMGSGRIANIGKYHFLASNYFSLRRFCCARNSILIMKEYPQEFTIKDYFNFIKYEFKALIKLILGETDKIKKISASLKGIGVGIMLITNKLTSYSGKLISLDDCNHDQ